MYAILAVSVWVCVLDGHVLAGKQEVGATLDGGAQKKQPRIDTIEPRRLGNVALSPVSHTQIHT